MLEDSFIRKTYLNNNSDLNEEAVMKLAGNLDAECKLALYENPKLQALFMEKENEIEALNEDKGNLKKENRKLKRQKREVRRKYRDAQDSIVILAKTLKPDSGETDTQ